MMVPRETDSVREIIQELLSSSDAPATPRELREADAHISALARIDYGKALRRHFERAEIQELIAELRRFLPELNRRVFEETDLRYLAATAARYGADLQASQFAGDDGHTLRGFYVHDYTILRRPLIGVNTAVHPAGVAAAFWHEMGHHFTHTIFGDAEDQVSLYVSTNYQDHLKHAEELVADALTVLACYPRFVAVPLFGDREKSADDPGAKSLISKVRPYLRAVTGFNFDGRLSATVMLNYLAGMTHFAKLREALLHEYGI